MDDIIDMLGYGTFWMQPRTKEWFGILEIHSKLKHFKNQVHPT